jgi:hypothetical protein
VPYLDWIGLLGVHVLPIWAQVPDGRVVSENARVNVPDGAVPRRCPGSLLSLNTHSPRLAYLLLPPPQHPFTFDDRRAFVKRRGRGTRGRCWNDRRKDSPFLKTHSSRHICVRHWAGTRESTEGQERMCRCGEQTGLSARSGSLEMSVRPTGLVLHRARGVAAPHPTHPSRRARRDVVHLRYQATCQPAVGPPEMIMSPLPLRFDG